jgi:hypothetical protein
MAIKPTRNRRTEGAPYGFTKSGEPRKRRSPEQARKLREQHNSNPKIIRVAKRDYVRTEKPGNYLKYHRIVFEWAVRKYKTKVETLEMLFFLYDEDVFTKTKFKEYDRIMPFEKYRIEKMIEEGWIWCWPDEISRRHKLYELTQKSKMLVRSMYRKLQGEEKISEIPEFNAIFEKLTLKDRVQSLAIRKMNERVAEKKKKERHPGRTDYKAEKPRK